MGVRLILSPAIKKCGPGVGWASAMTVYWTLSMVIVPGTCGDYYESGGTIDEDNVPFNAI